MDVQEGKRQMKPTLETLTAENEYLRKENSLWNQKFESALSEEFDKLKKWQKQRKNKSKLRLKMNH
ncbi:hypothetical protein SLEP1_g40165 [Rubroshorea leprosula]|uniref:Transposase n=1 Tax=Rubroshorea leprosula TaxID=152421 RepID=A0AAV5L2K5_9ROSI|nr:hypothetical protein SLEP1_g40165 [Rubroshorea leprosula]